jgi:hypothetical protein
MTRDYQYIEQAFDLTLFFLCQGAAAGIYTTPRPMELNDDTPGDRVDDDVNQ